MKQCTAAMLCVLALLLFAPCAWAQYDAQTAQNWLEQFAAEIAKMQPVGDAEATADPARAGEYLFEYPFGTVVARSKDAPAAHEILRVELTGAPPYSTGDSTITEWLPKMFCNNCGVPFPPFPKR